MLSLNVTVDILKPLFIGHTSISPENLTNRPNALTQAQELNCTVDFAQDTCTADVLSAQVFCTRLGPPVPILYRIE